MALEGAPLVPRVEPVSVDGAGDPQAVGHRRDAQLDGAAPAPRRTVKRSPSARRPQAVTAPSGVWVTRLSCAEPLAGRSAVPRSVIAIDVHAGPAAPTARAGAPSTVSAVARQTPSRGSRGVFMVSTRARFPATVAAMRTAARTAATTVPVRRAGDAPAGRTARSSARRCGNTRTRAITRSSAASSLTGTS